MDVYGAIHLPREHFPIIRPLIPDRFQPPQRGSLDLRGEQAAQRLVEECASTCLLYTRNLTEIRLALSAAGIESTCTLLSLRFAGTALRSAITDPVLNTLDEPFSEYVRFAQLRAKGRN